MAKFVKKPIVIEAVEWDETVTMLRDLQDKGMKMSSYSGHVESPDLCQSLRIWTLEGVMLVSPGDWIICDIRGEFYPCKPDIFAATYDLVSAERAGATTIRITDASPTVAISLDDVSRAYGSTHDVMNESPRKLAEASWMDALRWCERKENNLGFNHRKECFSNEATLDAQCPLCRVATIAYGFNHERQVQPTAIREVSTSAPSSPAPQLADMSAEKFWWEWIPAHRRDWNIASARFEQTLEFAEAYAVRRLSLILQTSQVAPCCPKCGSGKIRVIEYEPQTVRCLGCNEEFTISLSDLNTFRQFFFSPPSAVGEPPQWYKREEFVQTLRDLKYCEENCQELADWLMENIVLAFRKGYQVRHGKEYPIPAALPHPPTPTPETK